MPSSNKTGHLRLNSWLGGDKPKKDDFNSDNRLVDAACRDMDGRIGALETDAAAVTSHIADAASHLSQADRGALSAHMANLVSHITQEDRARWNTPVSNMTIGVYSGTGAATRKITLGFQAKFGVLFAVGVGVADADLANLESRMFAGFFSTSGSSKNIVLLSDGFTVVHTVSRPLDGLNYKYNETGLTYVYVAWPAD